MLITAELKSLCLRPLLSHFIALAVAAAGNASSALANQDMPFKELGGDQCFMFPQFYEHEDKMTQGVVIASEADYRKLFDQKNMRQSCAGGDLSKLIPKVDFSKETVLGLWASGSCAASGFKKRVLKDDIQKTIIYSVEVIHRIMACSGPGPESPNLISISAIPPGYKVIFENIPE